MATDERTFMAAIVGDSTVQTRVGTDGSSQTKVYASPAPQDTELPLITYFVVNESPTNKTATTSTSSRYLIQVDVFSRDKGQAKSIAAAVKAAGETVGYLEGSRDMYEQQLLAHRISMDFSFYGT